MVERASSGSVGGLPRGEGVSRGLSQESPGAVQA